MTQAVSHAPGSQPPALKPRDDVYTVLLIIGTAFVLTATIFLGYVCYGYYGTIRPVSGG